MITEHQYLSLYPIKNDSKKLILGTIHPHNHENFIVPFFYGNKCSLWTILSKAFPNELTNPCELNCILRFLDNRKISISDTIKRCERLNPTALDKDLIPTELNMGLKKAIKNSQIEEILFTSGFGKNNSFRLFYVNLLGLHISKEIKNNRGVTLDKSYFGRPIKLTVLYSPSGSANVGLSKSNEYLSNQSKYIGINSPVLNFKIDYYRQKFL